LKGEMHLSKKKPVPMINISHNEEMHQHLRPEQKSLHPPDDVKLELRQKVSENFITEEINPFKNTTLRKSPSPKESEIF